jgi:hypothetical protein
MPVDPLLPALRLRIDHLNALDAKIKQSEAKIGLAARTAAGVKNLPPSVHSFEQISTVAEITERNCVAVLGALNDGRSQVRRAIEKLEMADRILRGTTGPIRPMGPYSEALDILRNSLNPIVPVFQHLKSYKSLWNSVTDFIQRDKYGQVKRLTNLIGWLTKPLPKLDFLDDWSSRIGLAKVNGLAGRSLPVLKRLPWIGVAVDSYKVVTNIQKGSWGGALWHGAKIVAGLAVLGVIGVGAAIGGVPVVVIAGVALAAMSVAELIGTERFKKAGKWLLDKGKDAIKWAGEKASTGISWAKSQVKRVTGGVVDGVREAFKNPVNWGGPYIPTSPLLPTIGKGLQVIGGGFKTVGSALDNLGNGIGNASRMLT